MTRSRVAMTKLSVLAMAVLLASCPACSRAAPSADEKLPEPFGRLYPLHQRLGKPQPGDWLAHHEEPGQGYRDYVRSRPTMPDKRRRAIYVQPLGKFTPTQRKIVDLTADYMGRYFALPVKVSPDLSLDLVPAEARRKHPSWGMDQVLSTYVLDTILAPRLPDDAMAYIAFTPSDLWPGEGWNFVFGQASLDRRVGVWSLYRNGDPDAGEDQFRLCLLRTIKVATHETGHMFSMQHCTLYQCNMCGSNSLEESDRYPLWLCPICLAKLCHVTKADPARRFESLAAFCKQQGFKREEAFFEKSIRAIGK